MLMYSYPPKLDKREQVLKAAHDLEEHRKMQKNMYKNLAIAGAIVVIGFLAPPLIVKVILWLVGAGNIFVALLLYRVYALSRSTECYTRIYDDHIEHCQITLITHIKTEIVLKYSDVERSYQDKRGRLIVCLKSGAEPSVRNSKPYKFMDSELQNGRLMLDFQDTRAKLFLIENLHEQINYPKKEYNIIEDDDPDEHENIFNL
ncbi:MAG: hypothetical protein IKR76_11310 [Ruminococcus sp.]|nr:hypothetical protein [Ruminococcus sp.]